MASKVLRLRVPAVDTLLIMRSATMCLVRFPWCLRSWRCAATVSLNVSMKFGDVMWTRTQARGGKSPLSFFSASLSGVLGMCSNVPPITIPMGFALSMRNAMLSVIRDFISAAMAARPRHCVVWNRRRNAGRHQAHTERGCSQGCAAGSPNQGARLRVFF